MKIASNGYYKTAWNYQKRCHTMKITIPTKVSFIAFRHCRKESNKQKTGLFLQTVDYVDFSPESLKNVVAHNPTHILLLFRSIFYNYFDIL